MEHYPVVSSAHVHLRCHPTQRLKAYLFGLNDPCEVALATGARLTDVLKLAATEAQARAVDELDASLVALTIPAPELGTVAA